MIFTNLKEANEALAAKSQKLHEVFQAAGPDKDLRKVFTVLGVTDTFAAAARICEMNDELTDIGKERDMLDGLERARAQTDAVYRDSHEPVTSIVHPRPEDAKERPLQTKSIGRMFVESAEYRQFKGQRVWPTPASLDIDIRDTVFRTGAGWLPESIRLPGAVLSAQEAPAVIDAVPMLPTGMAAINYMEETTLTNAAVEKAESTATTAADLIGEATLVLTPRTMPVEWLPVFIPVTMQQMEDVEGIEAYVNSRLTEMLRMRLDGQILAGDGNTPNLKGTANIGGDLQTQAKGTDPTPDAVYKLFTKLRVTGKVRPSVIFFHPNDWQDIRLLRTADGIYIWGNPMDAGPERIWGVPVVQTTYCTENTAIAGDYRNYSALFTRRGITLAVSDSHAFYFTRGMLAIRADMRVAMVHFRTSAFGTVSGI